VMESEPIPDASGWRLQDRRDIADLRRKLAFRSKQKLPSDRLEHRLAYLERRAAARALTPSVERLRLAFPEDLPITARVDELAAAMRDHQVIIVKGSTGSGKTTQLPKIAIKAGFGRNGLIGCTQPRRIAAVSMAGRVAEETGAALGTEVGYQVRFDEKLSDATAIKFMTDGILLAETVSDPDWLAYEVLIVDEAHERSLNIDFILGYLKTLLPRRPDLRVVISSATLDSGNFSEFYDHAPVIEVEGRTYPIEDVYLPPEEEEDLPSHIARAVEMLNSVDRDGDILVFLPGEREIREAADLLDGRQWRNTDVLPLFARMGLGEQQKIFHPGSRRRIILSTNVAETSLTIPRVHYVIDSGQVRLSRFNPRNQVQELQIEQVSQASARQRRGRCGRIADGICIYLYDDETMAKSDPFTDPEIRRSALAGVILRMAVLGLPPIEHFPLPDPPQSALIRDGYLTLFNLGAMDAEHRLTAKGRLLSSFAIDPHLAAMVIQGRDERVLGETLAIAAYLSIMDPRERPAERKQAADQAHRQWHDDRSDFIGILNLWNFLHKEWTAHPSNNRFRRFCQANFLNYRRIREWFNLFQDLRDAVTDLDWQPQLPANLIFENLSYDHIHRALLAGIPTHLAKRDPEKKFYRGSRERQFHIFPGSALFKKQPEWILSFELVETTKLYARQAAEINPSWLEEIAPQLCTSVFDRIRWDRQRGFVAAREMVTSGGLLIHPGRAVHYGRLRPAEARTIFIRDALVPAELDTKGPWLDAHRRMLAEIRRRELKLRRPEALLDVEAVAAHFERLVPPEVCSVKTLELWQEKNPAPLAMPIDDAMMELSSPVDWDEFPDTLEFLGHPFRLEYHYDPGEENDGVIILCPEDQVSLLPDWMVDWTIPGWLPEKVRLLARALPKDLRVQLNPLADSVDAFLAGVKDGSVFTERLLLECLAEFFTARIGAKIVPDDFAAIRLPGYLTFKIGVQDKNGHFSSLTAGMPDRSGAGSRLSRRFKGAGGWQVSGASDWPGDCPETVEVDATSHTVGYPALADEGVTVGRQIFLDPREAQWAQRRGLVRLYRMIHADHLQFVRKKLPLSNAVKLTLAAADRGGGFADDLLDAAIYTAMTDGGRLEIRTEAVFRERLEAGRQLLYDTVKKASDAIESAVAERDKIVDLLKSKAHGPVAQTAADDIRAQLDFYFRPGFIGFPALLERYPRYFRALRIRTERMLGNPAKDVDKIDQVNWFEERFQLSLSSVADFTRAFDLQEFALALQEWRIAVFAPEVGTLMKITESRLKALWDGLRL